MTSPIRQQTISRTGWGVKQGSKVKNWKKRWFVLLSDGNLRYFVDKLVPDEQGHIQIANDSTIATSAPIDEGFPIQIVTKSRTFLVAFPTQQEMDDWKASILALQPALQ